MKYIYLGLAMLLSGCATYEVDKHSSVIIGSQWDRDIEYDRKLPSRRFLTVYNINGVEKRRSTPSTKIPLIIGANTVGIKYTKSEVAHFGNGITLTSIGFGEIKFSAHAGTQYQVVADDYNTADPMVWIIETESKKAVSERVPIIVKMSKLD